MILKGLKLYTVHVHPDQEFPQENPKLVSEGFNLWAFLLTFLWAFYEKMWLQGIAIIAVNVALVVANKQYGLAEGSIAALQLGYQFLIGFHGNDWLRERLARRGYVITDVVSGDNLLRAEQRYFERYLAGA